MSERKRFTSEPKQGASMSSQSVAAEEAFALLNAGTKQEFRGWGDTKTAARDRAARKAGVTPAQGERLWKHWQTMKTVNGDVYRLLRNQYAHLCERIEAKADAWEREAQKLEAENAAVVGRPSSSDEGMEAAARRKEG